jgi:hypothetical protein
MTENITTYLQNLFKSREIQIKFGASVACKINDGIHELHNWYNNKRNIIIYVGNQESIFIFYSGISNWTSSCTSLAKLTIFDNLTDKRAASSKLSHASILSPDAAIKTLASSTFVPC